MSTKAMRDDNFYYTYENEMYKFYAQGEELFSTETLAIAYAWHPDLPIKITLHRHGLPKTVSSWYDKTIRKYIDNDLKDLALELALIQSSEFSVGEINSMIACTGYVPEFIEELHTTRKGI